MMRTRFHPYSTFGAAALLTLTASVGWAQSQTQDKVVEQALVAKGEKIVMGGCFVCHGVQGESSSEFYPKLGGQHAEYIAKQLDNFKSGRRQSTAMAGMVMGLSVEDMRAAGAYFEHQAHPKEAPQKPELVAAGKQLYLQGNASKGLLACATCHGEQAKGTALLPRLAGQFAHYTDYQLKQFRSGARKNDGGVMQGIAQKLSDAEIAALAEYLSGE